MSESPTPPWRLWAARGVVAALLLASFFSWQRFEVLDIQLEFGIGPSLRAEDGRGLSRSSIVGIEGRVVTGDGEEAARWSQDLPQGLMTPVTPLVGIRLPRGSYGLHLVLTSLDGRRALRARPLEIEDPGRVRVEID